MGMTWHLDRVLDEKDVTINELSLKVGISAYDLTNIKNGSVTALRIATLSAICEALHCQPGDILEYTPDVKKG
ncbi:MAG: helix-turn-helix transcriptional regulator [Oscillospiraceae bacterium]|nr:helix-turn-helix transcriptional regulator [Oscillospiraceae bacterium]